MRGHISSRTRKKRLLLLISLIILFIAVPSGCFAEPGIQNEQTVPTLFDVTSPMVTTNLVPVPTGVPSDAPVPTLYGTSSAALQGTLIPTLYGNSGFISVKLWTPAHAVSATPFREGWFSENDLVTSYAMLVNAGNGLSYPGGMPAGSGGGDSMGGGSGGGSGGGGGGGCGG